MKKMLILFLVAVVLLGVAGTGLYFFLLRGPSEAEISEGLIAAQYASAEAFYRDNPTAFDQALSRFHNIIFEHPDSSWATKAQGQITVINAARQAVADATWKQLSRDADALSESDSPEAAITFLQTYEGPYLPDFENKIKGKVLSYYRVIKARENAEQERAEVAGKALDQLIQDVAAKLYIYRFADAAALIDEAPNNLVYEPIRPALNSFCSHARDVIEIPQAVCNNILQAQNGANTVTVPLKSGTKKLKINGVDGSTVLAERIIVINGREAGSTPDNFTFSDLSMKGQAQFLGKSTDPAHQIMRALILIQAGRLDNAAKYLSLVDSQLAEVLNERVRQSMKKEAKPVRKPFEPVFDPDEKNELIVL